MAAVMDDPPLQKIAISGPTLASLIQRFSTSPSAVDGLLFGHVTCFSPFNLSDDSTATSAIDLDSDSTTLVATVTGFFCSGTVYTFYDSNGTVQPTSLHRFLTDQHHSSLIGWFSGRGKSQIRPSMREFSVTASLSSMAQFSSPIKNATGPINFNPCVFLLFASPLSDQIIHTHEYHAYQFRRGSESFVPKSIDIVNIGPAFRGHYGSFSPNSPFPSLACDLRGSPMNEDMDEERLSRMKRISKDQKELDMCAQGFEVGSLSRLMGSEAKNYTLGLEDLYEKMLFKIENLTKLVEKSSARVLEQENHNRKLRHKILRSAASE